MSYRELTRRQPPPFASVGFGAGGIAYALWHVGRRRRSAELDLHARRWIAAATRAARGRASFWNEHFPPVPIADSLSDGPAGLPLVAALIAPAGSGARARHVERFLAHCRPRRLPEVVHGTAGILAGALVLSRHVDDARLGPAIAGLAAPLLSSLETPGCGLPPEATAFAHGAAGVLHTVLEWAHVTGGAPPARMEDRLEDVARASRRPVAPDLTETWCNGAAGLCLLWTKAYRHYGDRRFLRRAVAAATLLGRRPDASGSLCCGLGGAAYALLALERVRPGHGAAERAELLAARAIRAGAAGWPNGLSRGYPGLVCLAADLLDGGGGGFPLVEPTGA